MAFLDDLSRKLTMVGQEAASQTKAFAETARINAKISDEERQINALFSQLGRNYFESNKDNPNAEQIDLINNIKDAMHRIEVYRGDIRRAKGMVNCPQCGAEVASNITFCSYCGVKLPQIEYPSNDGVMGFTGGLEGLGSTVVSKDGIYSTPNSNGTSLNYDYGTSVSDYDNIESHNVNNSTPISNNDNDVKKTNGISLEKKNEL